MVTLIQHLFTIKFVDYYRKIDLAKTINGSINGMQINCPKAVERSFFFASLLIGKLWIKNIIHFILIAWKYLPLKNENIWNKSKKKTTKWTKIKTIWI